MITHVAERAVGPGVPMEHRLASQMLLVLKKF